MRKINRRYIGIYKCNDCKEMYIVYGKSLKEVEEELKGQSFRDALKDLLINKTINFL